MAEQDVMRAIGRLEKALEDQSKTSVTQLELFGRELAAQKASIAHIAESHMSLEARLARAEKAANNAIKKSSDSSAEIQTLSDSIVVHIANLESSMSGRWETTQHRLAAQDATLANIQETQADATKANRGALWKNAAVIIAAIPLVDHTLVPLLTYWLGR